MSYIDVPGIPWAPEDENGEHMLDYENPDYQHTGYGTMDYTSDEEEEDPLFSLGVSTTQATETGSSDEILHRTCKEIHFHIGARKTLFKVESDFLDSCSEYFRTRPGIQIYDCPNLTSTGFRIALDILRSAEVGTRRKTSNFDVMNNCFDVLVCAEQWDLFQVRDEVLIQMQQSPMLPEIYNHQLFLHQLYQMYNFFEFRDDSVFEILGICVQKVKGEHDIIATSFSVAYHRLRNQPPTQRDIIFNNLMTEYTRIMGDCNCPYCREHRRKNESINGILSNHVKMALYEATRVVKFCGKGTRYFFSSATLWGLAWGFILQAPFIGYLAFNANLLYALEGLGWFYSACTVYLFLVTSILLLFGILRSGAQQIPTMLYHLWPILLAVYYPALALVGIVVLARYLTELYERNRGFLSGPGSSTSSKWRNMMRKIQSNPKNVSSKIAATTEAPTTNSELKPKATGLRPKAKGKFDKVKGVFSFRG